jgi:large subunit ribosomal protein L4
VIVADEKDKTQNPAAGDAAVEKADKPAKPARAPRKAQPKPAADKPAARARSAAKPPASAAKPAAKPPASTAAATDSATAEAATEPVAKPPRRRAKPAAEEAVEPVVAKTPAAALPAKPARKRAAAAKPSAAEAAPAAPAGRKPAKAAAAPAQPARKAKADHAVERADVRRAPDERVALVFDADGKQVEEIKLSVERFGLATDINLLHLAVRAEQAARRRGTASTKTRGEISGSTAKLYRQKGTGRARAGSVKSPTRSGGGTAFGPKPRSYELKINRKAAHKALTMALSDRAEGGSIYVARGLDLEAPSTATVNELLMTLDIPAPVLVVTDDEPVVARSVRNLRYAESGEARRLSVEQVLRNRSLVVTEKALSVLTGA